MVSISGEKHPGNTLAIEVNNLTVKFDGFAAVNNVSFSMVKNASVGIIGPNGAGKTTFVSLLTGQFAPFSGTVKLFGHDVTRMSAARRVKMGMVRSFQLVQVFDSLTVHENIGLSLYNSKFGRRSLAGSFFGDLFSREYKERIEEIRSLFRLSSFKSEAVSSLSLGNKKKLEIAMIYIMDPELMVLDEPFAGLGDQEIDEVLLVLKECVHKKTILIVEHKLSKLTEVVDNLAVMHEGRFIASGPCEETLQNPEVRKSYWKISECEV